MPSKGFYRQAALLSSLGVTFAVMSSGGFVLGHWLDGRFLTKPLLTLLLGLLGVLAAFIHLIRTIQEADRLSSGNDDDEPDGQ